MIVVRSGASILSTGPTQEIQMEERVIVDSSFSAVINAPIEKIDIPVWCFSPPDEEYQECSPAHFAAFTSDTVDNYEFGGKLEGFNNRLILTGAVFQMNWNNIQQAIIAPVSYIRLFVNAGDARVRGGEIALEAKPNLYRLPES